MNFNVEYPILVFYIQNSDWASLVSSLLFEHVAPQDFVVLRCLPLRGTIEAFREAAL